MTTVRGTLTTVGNLGTNTDSHSPMLSVEPDPADTGVMALMRALSFDWLVAGESNVTGGL